MAYVVTEACIKCRYAECAEVCPQNALKEGKNFFVIDPHLCSNCALCEMVCPVNAIYAEYDVPADQKAFIKLNADLARLWPAAQFRAPPTDADHWASVTEKADMLSSAPYEENRVNDD